MEALQQENERLLRLLAHHGINSTDDAPSQRKMQTDQEHVAHDVAGHQQLNGRASCGAPAGHLASFHSLTPAQVERYSRHLLLPAVGLAAQERLVQGSVLIVGCGGLGSPAAMYLAAAGVGKQAMMLARSRK
jgi:hypothetical protein